MAAKMYGSENGQDSRCSGNSRLRQSRSGLLIGYMRVSKNDGSQVLDLQRDALLSAGVMEDQLYSDSAVGRVNTIDGKRALHPTTRTCGLGGGQLHSRAYIRGNRGSRSAYTRGSRSAYTRSHGQRRSGGHVQRRDNGLRH
jgi:hypothetical protein